MMALLLSFSFFFPKKKKKKPIYLYSDPFIVKFIISLIPVFHITTLKGSWPNSLLKDVLREEKIP
jgi:hypothetical protein